MIIFDLDGTLANCEHRRHFVDINHNWKSFYEACDQDKIILPVAFQFYALREKFGICHPIQIWSGRCDSVRGKTIDWLQKHFTRDIDWVNNLKMRPIGDYTPDEQLKEKWLDEYLYGNLPSIEALPQIVFDDSPKSIQMWRRRGIFVFDVNQTGEEF